MRELVDRPSPRPMVGAGVGRLVSCVCWLVYGLSLGGFAPSYYISLFYGDNKKTCVRLHYMKA
jgi:hypothetical protein